MNTKTTWWLVGLAAALLACIYLFEETPWRARQSAAGPGPLLANFNASAVTAIEIRRTNGVIRAYRTNDLWVLSDPAYPGQITPIESFLRTIEGLSQRAYVSPQTVQTDGLKAFGLEPPAASVLLQAGSNRIRLEIGSKTPLANQLYVQTGPIGISLTDLALLDHLPHSSSDWRDRRLLNLPVFNRLQIRSWPNLLELERDRTNLLWRIAKPIQARADTNLIAQLINELQNARVVRFVTDTPHSDLERYGLQTPGLEVSFSLDASKVASLEFGSSPTNEPGLVYVRRSEHTNVVLISRDLVEKLRLPYKSFQDPTLIAFPIARVSSIEVGGPGTNGLAAGLWPVEPFTLQLDSTGSWRVTAPRVLPADRGLVTGFLSNLTAMQILDSAKDVPSDVDLAAFQFSPPVRRYTMVTATTNAAGLATNITLAQIDFGKIPTNQPDRVFVRRGDETPVYITSLADMLQLPRRPLDVRDRRIWSFASSNVTAVSLVQLGKTNRSVRVAAPAWSRDTIKSAAIEETLHRLGDLRSLGWIDEGTNRFATFGIDAGPELSMELRSERIERASVRFGKRTVRNNVYAAVAFTGETRPIIFEFPGALFEQVLTEFTAP